MKQMKNKGNRTMMMISLIFTFCGVVMLCGGIYFALSNARFSKNALMTTGIISDIEIGKDHDGDIHHYVYLDTMMNVGDIVPIYIDVNNPDNYYVDVENVELQNAGIRGLPEDTFYNM